MPPLSGIENQTSVAAKMEATMSISDDSNEARGRVRPMMRHDLPVVSGLIARLARHHGDRPAIDVSRLEADLFAPVPWVQGLVVERFGYVVGYALMTARYHAQWTRRGLELDHLFVLEGSRGLGLGRKLVAAVIDHARTEGCAFLKVGTHADNAHAPAFYAAIGFSERIGRDGLQFALRLEDDAAAVA
jgi:GNAT superfamily N-acetyltransferase